LNRGEEDELARLLRAAIAGDERAYGDFLRGAADLVRGFARRRLGRDGIDPEDIVQETLLATHAKRHTWRADAPVKPWLYGIARYKLIDAVRRRTRRAEVDLGDIAETVASPEAEVASQREVGRALGALAPGQRSAVSAVCVEGRSIREAAAQRGISESAMRVALHRGLAAIARRAARG
jgi:RNA polymerase sigma-70 factor (ECF subfamily)